MFPLQIPRLSEWQIRNQQHLICFLKFFLKMAHKTYQRPNSHYRIRFLSYRHTFFIMTQTWIKLSQ